MAYERDHDAHHKTVGAIAARDGAMARRAHRRASILSSRTKARDRQLAGLTYGARGGLLGMGLDRSIGGSVARATLVNVGPPSRSPDSGYTPAPPVYPGGGAITGSSVAVAMPTGVAPPLVRPTFTGFRAPSAGLFATGSGIAPASGSGLPMPTPTQTGPSGGTIGGGSGATGPVSGSTTPSGGGGGTPISPTDGGGISGGGGAGTPINPPTITITPVSPVPDLQAAPTSGIPTWALVAGGALAIYLLTRR